MHSAPSVSYPVGRSRFLGALLLSAWIAGAGVLLLWGGEVRPSAPAAAAAAFVLLGAGGLALRSWWRTPDGELAWDGERWSWAGTPGEGDEGVEVGLDLQRHLLLRWGRGGRSRWIWAERARHPERWHDLRRAVYSRARPQALAGAQLPAAKP